MKSLEMYEVDVCSVRRLPTPTMGSTRSRNIQRRSGLSSPLDELQHDEQWYRAGYLGVGGITNREEDEFREVMVGHRLVVPVPTLRPVVTVEVVEDTTATAPPPPPPPPPPARGLSVVSPWLLNKLRSCRPRNKKVIEATLKPMMAKKFAWPWASLRSTPHALARGPWRRHYPTPCEPD